MSDPIALSLIERGLALVARGRALDRRWEGMKGGSATPIMWAEEAYDDLLDAWERDARQWYERQIAKS